MLWKSSCCGALLCATVFGFESKLAISTDCQRMNSTVSNQIAGGHLNDAKRIVMDWANLNVSRREPICAGLLSNNVAAGLQISGRLDEAQRFAEQAISYFQKGLPADHAAYLAPLHILASIALEQNRIGNTREISRKMQLIRTTEPHDRALVLSIRGSLSLLEGKNQQAEKELLTALLAVSDAGNAERYEAASLRGQLANLYIQEHHFQLASDVVEDALSTLQFDKDEQSLVRMKLLDTRAVIRVHENRWRDAESDLAEAISLTRQQPKIHPAELWPVLTNYAYVLKKLHRKEAPSVVAWAASLRAGLIGLELASRQGTPSRQACRRLRGCA